MSELYKKMIREIKRQMFRRGMNIRMTAEALGCHRVNLSAYLNLKTMMKADLLLKCIDIFDINVNRIVGVLPEEYEVNHGADR